MRTTLAIHSVATTVKANSCASNFTTIHSSRFTSLTVSKPPHASKPSYASFLPHAPIVPKPCHRCECERGRSHIQNLGSNLPFVRPYRGAAPDELATRHAPTAAQHPGIRSAHCLLWPLHGASFRPLHTALHLRCNRFSIRFSGELAVPIGHSQDAFRHRVYFVAPSGRRPMLPGSFLCMKPTPLRQAHLRWQNSS